MTSRARGALLCHSIQRLGPGKEGSERALEQQHIVLLNQKSSIQIYRPETNEKQADRIDGVDSGRMVVANE